MIKKMVYDGKDTKTEAVRQLLITPEMVGKTLEAAASLEDCTCKSGEVHLRLGIVKTEPQTTAELLRQKGKVHKEVYERVMKVVKHDREISNPEEIWLAIFGHPQVKIVPPCAIEEVVVGEPNALGRELATQAALDQAAGIGEPKAVHWWPKLLESVPAIWAVGAWIDGSWTDDGFRGTLSQAIARADWLNEQEQLQVAEGEVKHG